MFWFLVRHKSHVVTKQGLWFCKQPIVKPSVYDEVIYGLNK